MKLSSSKSDWEIWIKVAQLQQHPKPAERSNISWLKCIVASAMAVCDGNGIIRLLIILGIYESLSEKRTARMQMVVSSRMALELIKIIQTSTFGSCARQMLWVTGPVALTKDRVPESCFYTKVSYIWDIKCTSMSLWDEKTFIQRAHKQGLREWNVFKNSTIVLTRKSGQLCSSKCSTRCVHLYLWI